MFFAILLALLQEPTRGPIEVPPIFRLAALEEDPVNDEQAFGLYPLAARGMEAGGSPYDDFRHPHDSFPDFFLTHGSSKAWRYYVWEDYLTQPAVLIPLGLGATAAIVSHWDKPWEKRLRGTMGGHQTIGNVTLYTLLGGAIISGILFPGEGRNAWDQTFTEGESFGATALTTFALKETVRRPRPFEGGGSVHSFPSGHSSGAFCAATLIERNSGELGAVPAYGLAALTAYSRVDSARHYPSDVLAGAAIGILTARIFDGLHWGSGGKGGIARPSTQLGMDFGGRRDILLTLDANF